MKMLARGCCAYVLSISVGVLSARVLSLSCIDTVYDSGGYTLWRFLLALLSSLRISSTVWNFGWKDADLLWP